MESASQYQQLFNFNYTPEFTFGSSNIIVGGGDGDFVLVILILGTSASLRSIVTSNFDNSTPAILCSSESLLPPRPV
jgi:hypothetical protein